MQTLEDKKRFGLREGDIVRTTDEHDRLLSRPIKDGVILFIEGEIATIDLGDGERTAINCYWLKKAKFSTDVTDPTQGVGKE